MKKTSDLKRLYFDSQKCMLCMECMRACQERLGEETASQLRPVYETTAKTPWIWVCRQCLTPPCVETCFTGGLARLDRDQAIHHDQSRCVGCGSCVLSCPLDGVRIEGDQHAPMKCDLCAGMQEPLCARVCPSGAIIFTDANTFNQARRTCYAKKLKHLA